MEGEVTRLSVFLTEDDRGRARSAWKELIERAREDGMAGATVWRGIEGFGRSGYLRSARAIDAAQGLPVVFEVIDQTERVDAFLPVVAHVAPDAFVVRQQLQQLQRSARQPATYGTLDDPRPRSPSGHQHPPAGGDAPSR
jgi:PII-like signaling protein